LSKREELLKTTARAPHIVLLLTAGIVWLVLTACGSESSNEKDNQRTNTVEGRDTPAEEPSALLAGALLMADPTSARDTTPIVAMGESSDRSYIPVLVEFLRFPWLLEERHTEAVLTSLGLLIGTPYEDLERDQLEWDWWVEWLGTHPEVEPVEGYAGWKGRLLSLLLDPSFSSFLYDGVTSTIRVEEIVWGGVAKDGIPDLMNPPVLPADKATYLDPFDRVFGLSINGEHRAYPLRILNAHEMANDTLGGVPFALAY
jgi:hypothetical protein